MAKVGAEGVRRSAFAAAGWGIAIKVADGNARAAPGDRRRSGSAGPAGRRRRRHAVRPGASTAIENYRGIDDRRYPGDGCLGQDRGSEPPSAGIPMRRNELNPAPNDLLRAKRATRAFCAPGRLAPDRGRQPHATQFGGIIQRNESGTDPSVGDRGSRSAARGSGAQRGDKRAFELLVVKYQRKLGAAAVAAWCATRPESRT